MHVKENSKYELFLKSYFQILGYYKADEKLSFIKIAFYTR